jgi:predicted small metal-binding protein
MKNLILIFAALTLSTITACSNTRPEAPAQGMGDTYRSLMLKDYDEMLKIVKKHAKQAHKIVMGSESNSDWQQQAMDELIKAERTILSRPNNDNMVAKLTLEVRREMTDVGNYEDILAKLVHESIDAMKPDMNLPTINQSTYTFVFENLMSEMKPEIANNDRQRALVEEIRDADVQVPYEVMRERKLQGMFLTESPSDEAKRILEEAGFKKGKKRKH